MIDTGRLRIIPLNYNELGLYLQSKGRFEKFLKLTNTGRTLVPEIKKRVQEQVLPKMKAAGKDDYLFHTFWIVVDRSERVIVAELGFKGVPDTRAEIEIGYGTFPQQRGKGYMTEALGGMLGWAQARPDVKAILAETEETNLASIRVLQKNNFLITEKKRNMIYWSRGSI
jgi:ribosomal-protein-alanine N-acetyltransferase